MSIQEYSEGVKSEVASWKLRRKFFWLLAFVAVLGIAYVSFYLYYPYSEGSRTGVVRKLSRKGFVFKTWEGELQMSGIQTVTDGSQIITGGNVWEFSVGSDKAVLAELEKASTNGKRVSLYYTEYLKQFFWRGDTKYFITKVTPAE
jgi:hypothetical protein